MTDARAVHGEVPAGDAGQGGRDLVWVFLASRTALALFAFVVRWGLHPEPFVPDPVARPYLGVALETSPWLEPWQRWDTLHYQALAEQGYLEAEGGIFAPPFYPLLMRITGAALGGNTLAGGLLVANASFLAALLLFYRHAASEVGVPAARRAGVYLTLFPAGLFFAAAYAESLFLLTALATMEALRRRSWRPAALAASLGSLVRWQGLSLPAVVSLELLTGVRRGALSLGRASVALALASAGAAAFVGYITFGLGLAVWEPLRVQAGRFRGVIALPGAGIVQALRLLASGQASPTDVGDLMFTLLYLALLLVVWRRLPRIYGVFATLVVGSMLLKVGDLQPLISAPRLGLVAYPMFMVLGAWGGRPWVHRLILYASCAGLLYFTGQFVLWGWVA